MLPLPLVIAEAETPATITGSRESKAIPPVFFIDPGDPPAAEGLFGAGLMKLGISLMALPPSGDPP